VEISKSLTNYGLCGMERHATYSKN
jgi:hypothetical protein